MFATAPEHVRGIDNPSPVDARAGRRSCEIMKNALDCCLALVMLVLTAPIVLLSMLLVVLTSRGRALYTQQRLGRQGRLFRVYKIRTMYQDSERDTGAVWAVPGDFRVTPVGRFLRQPRRRAAATGQHPDGTDEPGRTSARASRDRRAARTHHARIPSAAERSARPRPAWPRFCRLPIPTLAASVAS